VRACFKFLGIELEAVRFPGGPNLRPIFALYRSTASARTWWGHLKLARFPVSLAATRCGFTFYRADPSARLTTIALGGSGEWSEPGGRDIDG